MNPGKLQHKGAVWDVTESITPDTRGDEQLTPVLFKTIWCSIEPLQGREMILAQQLHGNVTHKIGMRYTAGLTKRMYILWNGRRFNLGPALNAEERRFEHSVYATEIV